MKEYGIDEYSRYIVGEDGERYCIEEWPFMRPFHRRLVSRWSIICWHIGIIRQHGLREWQTLKRY